MPVAKPVAVVTGASSGIGAALVRKLAGHGFYCVLLARRAERVRAVAREVGGEAAVCDVADRSGVEAVAAAVLERHPRVALLVNNAGIPARTSFLDGDPERIEAAMRVNYLGSVWCLRAFLPGLEAAGRADVVNVVSVAGTLALPRGGPYAASKHAQLAFSRATEPVLRRRGIRVHTILPGFVETEGFPQRGRLGSSLLERSVIEPEDVAERIVAVLRSGRVERFVPWWYRAFTLAQAVAPAVVRRASARGGSRPEVL